MAGASTEIKSPARRSLTGTAFAGDSATVHCTGVNSCKGQGFLQMSKKDCEAAQAKAKGK
jgi:hypothetical protein